MTDQPLWLLMWNAYQRAYVEQGLEVEDGYAAEIEAIRDRIVPEELEPMTPGLLPEHRWKSILWCTYDQRQAIRTLLTAEAERARKGE